MNRKKSWAIVFACCVLAMPTCVKLLNGFQTEDAAAAIAMGVLLGVAHVLVRPVLRIVGENAPGAKRAELVTRSLAVRGGLTLTDVELFTGRAHQIRVQHASAGYPLWGDARYGGGKPGQQLALWAYMLTIKHPTRDEVMTFSARPPKSGAWLNFDDVIDERMADE